jgi:AraC family transcriptional regulator of adaptative response / methylphosphotriester-DNA alkyltransferase methyltransferase
VAPGPETSARAKRAPTLNRRFRIYRDAVAIVEAEYSSRLRLDDVAQRVFASRRQLQRCYAEIGRTTFRQHLMTVRMERAGTLLATRALSVRETARRVAYPHPAQFAKAFRHYHGVAPSAFRAGVHERQAAATRNETARKLAMPELPGAAARVTIAGDAIDDRITSLLRRLDRDHDDILDTFDLEEWVDRLGALRGWEPGDDGYSALTIVLIDQFCPGLHASSGTDDDRISARAMCARLRTIARSHPTRVIGWSNALFDLLDTGVTGLIGIEQYRDLLSSLCVSHSAADASFARMDTVGRGHMSRDEFNALYLGFLLDEHPDAVAAWFWGPRAAPSRRARPHVIREVRRASR